MLSKKLILSLRKLPQRLPRKSTMHPWHNSHPSDVLPSVDSSSRLYLSNWASTDPIAQCVALQTYNLNMGNTKSQQAANTERHDRLGEVTLSDSTDEEGTLTELMTLTRIVESESEFTRWRREMSKIDDSVTRQVLLLPTRTVFESTGMCGSSGSVQLTYEHFPYVFQVEIDNRRNIGRYFMETELWYLLYTLIRAGSKFEKYHAKIGDVHPTNILINNDGLVKVISTCSLPREETNFDKIVENSSSRVFLAPEEMEQHSIERAEYPKNIDPSLAECYSIGLSMLSAGTLEDVDSIYSAEGGEHKILKHKVNYYLKLFGEKYSSYLHSIVMGLLADNPLERKKCSEIYQSLYEYEDKILELESFIPGNSRLYPNTNPPAHVQPTFTPPVQPPQPVLSSQHNQYSVQARTVYQQPQSHQSLSQLQPLHSRASSTNVYYNPNGVVVNPIESKYVPINQINGQPTPSYHVTPNNPSYPNTPNYPNPNNPNNYPQPNTISSSYSNGFPHGSYPSSGFPNESQSQLRKYRSGTAFSGFR